MPSETKQPHVVMVVDNSVVVDGRVLRSARTARKSGYRVTVLGLDLSGTLKSDALQDIPMMRFEPAPGHGTRAIQRNAAKAEDGRLAVAESQGLVDALGLQREGTPPGPQTHLMTARVHIAHRRLRRARRRRDRLANTFEVGTAAKLRSVGASLLSPWPAAFYAMYGAWARELSLTFTRRLVDLEPDIIHAQDAFVLPACVVARDILKSAGTEVPLIYDAHEHWSNRRDRHPRLQSARAAERRYSDAADAVIAVNAEIAQFHGRSRPGRPVAVLPNGPAADLFPMEGRQTVRDELGLEPSTPLMVYSGSVNDARGVDTAIQALGSLDDTHLVVVANMSRPKRHQLFEQARAAGVQDRIHIRPYVDPDSVSWYLSTATVGLSPLKRTPNHDVAIPTKLAEYLIAGIPVVVSDCPTQAQFIRESGLGTVHKAGDAKSLAESVTQAIRMKGQGRTPEQDALIRSLSWDEHAHHIPQTYESLLALSAASDSSEGRVVYAPAGLASTLSDRAGKLLSPGNTDDGAWNNYVTLARSEALVLAGAQDTFGHLTTDREAEARLINAVSPTTVVIAQRDDLLPPSTLIELWPQSDLASWSTKRRRHHERSSKERRAFLDALVGTRLVNDPEMTGHWPGSEWLPTTVDDTAFNAPTVSVNPGSPVPVAFLHQHAAASWSNVNQELEHLRDQNVIRFVDDATDAAIAIGDLVNGTYGPQVARALAAGTVVLGAPGPVTRSLLPDLPLVITSIDRVVATLVGLVNDPPLVAAKQQESREFAQRCHDGALSREVLDRGLTGDDSRVACEKNAPHSGSAPSEPSKARTTASAARPSP